MRHTSETPRNVIGDIAGNFLTLQALLAKMPSGLPVSVGDMVDRGPRSREVIEFFMHNGHEAVVGNHEHMMIADLRGRMRLEGYDAADWRLNGANQTLESYGYVPVAPTMYGPARAIYVEGPSGTVPEAHLAWIEALPTSRQFRYGDKTYFVSHAPQSMYTIRNYSFFDQIWERGPSERLEGVDLAIYGHNARFRYESDDKGLFAVCIDTSHENPKVLTGIHLPTLELFHQPIID